MTATAGELSQKAGQAPQESGQASQEGIFEKSLRIIKDHTAVATLGLLVAVGGGDRAMAQTNLPPGLEYTVANPEKVSDEEEIVIAVNNTPQPISQSVGNQVIEDLKTPLLTPEEMGEISEISLFREKGREYYGQYVEQFKALPLNIQHQIAKAVYSNEEFLNPDFPKEYVELVKNLRIPKEMITAILKEAEENGADPDPDFGDIGAFEEVLMALRDNAATESGDTLSEIITKYAPKTSSQLEFVYATNLSIQANEAATAKYEAATAKYEAATAKYEAAAVKNETATAKYQAEIERGKALDRIKAQQDQILGD